MIPFDLHSLWPSVIYLTPLALIFIFFFWKLYLHRIQKLENTQFARIDKRSPWIFWTKAIFFSIAWIAATIALMQPVGNGHYPEQALPQANIGKMNIPLEVKRKAHDVIFLIDASASMEVKDTREGKSRLDSAKEISDEIIRLLDGDNIALYAFTSKTTEVSPLTLDALYVRFMLSELGVNEGGFAGTDLTDALGTIHRKFLSKPTKRLKT
jgi:Ca-activated chloride channel family protein